MKKNQIVILELKNTIFEIEKSVGELYSWLNRAKHMISKLEDISRKYQLTQEEKKTNEKNWV